jgi:hypothetical protein
VAVGFNKNYKLSKERPALQETIILVELVVEQKNAQLEASLTFTNTGTHAVDLVKFVTLEDGQPDNNLFTIITQTGAELPYRGKMKKRAPPGPDGFHCLAPGQCVRGKIRLNDFYPIPKKGGLQISYGSQNHFATHQQHLLSNPVTIIVDRLRK